MAKDNNKKQLSVFSDVIKSLAIDAASAVEGVVLHQNEGIKKLLFGSGTSVSFLPNDKVTVSITIDIHSGYTIPTIVAAVQEKVKSEVEGSTKYHIHSVNINVKKVLPQ
jgi:uncharacterized alkaline shock family protein YloU